MPEVSNGDVTIRYDVVGQGRPLILMHGWCCERTWWDHAGFTADLQRDFRVVNLDLRGHGASDKPHEPLAYTAEAILGDLFAVADAEGFDHFAIWGLSYGAWIGWLAGQARPDRVAALIASGSWHPRPDTMDDWAEFDETFGVALRSGGAQGLVDLFKEMDGDAYATEFPPWAEEATLRADAEALLAVQAPEVYALAQGITSFEDYPVPALLTAGALEDESDEAAVIASRLPHGQSLRLPGLGHGGGCAASALLLPTARAFLDRWYV